jgi:hypothetical protein
MRKERQVHLAHGKAVSMVCWIEDKPSLKVGAYITLKDCEEPTWRWKILFMSKPMLRTETDKIRSKNVFDSIMPKS